MTAPKIERVHISIPKPNLDALKRRYKKKNGAEAITAFLGEFGQQITDGWQDYTPRRDHSRLIPETMHADIWQHHERLVAEKVKHPAIHTADWVRQQLRQAGKRIKDDQISDAIIYRIVREQRALQEAS